MKSPFPFTMMWKRTKTRDISNRQCFNGNMPVIEAVLYGEMRHLPTVVVWHRTNTSLHSVTLKIITCKQLAWNLKSKVLKYTRHQCGSNPDLAHLSTHILDYLKKIRNFRIKCCLNLYVLVRNVKGNNYQDSSIHYTPRIQFFLKKHSKFKEHLIPVAHLLLILHVLWFQSSPTSYLIFTTSPIWPFTILSPVEECC